MTFELPSDRPEPAIHRPVTQVRHKFLARLSRLLDAILPRTCGLCGLIHAGAGICPGCTERLAGLTRIRCQGCARPVRPGLAAIPRCADCRHIHRASQTTRPAPVATLTLADYAMPIDRMLLAAKRGNRPHLARAIGVTMAQSLMPRLPMPAWPGLIVPIPLSGQRLRWRGFNQAGLMAVEIARQWQIPCDQSSLIRVRDTASQQSLDRLARLGNMVNAFKCKRPLTGRRVALVDDVMTSGATARAAALALREAGAASILILVAARTP